MPGLLRHVLNLPPPVIYTIVGVLVFSEDALFVGFVIPGETAAIVAGFAASRSLISLPLTLLAVATAAIVGDSVGYAIGRRFGPRLLESRPLAGRRARIARARELLASRGGVAVFLGRFVAFFRAVMPALAGAAGMRYRTFLLYNVLGGLCWTAGAVMLGYLAGSSYRAAEQLFGKATVVVVAVIVIALLIGWRIHDYRAARRGHDARDHRHR